MRNNQVSAWAVAAAALAAASLLALPQRAVAQMNSLGTFSPYTMYGLGDMAIGGSGLNRGMGGVGVGYRNSLNFNYLNPAALGAMPQRSALFNFAAEGANIYAKSGDSKTAYNTFNIHDLGLAVPLGRGVGFGISFAPVSSVGYTAEIIDENPQIIGDVGRSIYAYSGEGGVSQVAMSLGVNVTRNLALGASANYLFGSITRQYTATTYSYLVPANFRTILASEQYNVSKILFQFGAQYSFEVGKGNGLTLGVTYQPEVNTSMRYRQSVLSISQVASDTVAAGKSRSQMGIPAKLAAGIFYHSPKFGIGFDYSRQDWAGAFAIPLDQQVSLGVQEDFKVGLSFSPNPLDIRRAMNRWNYKLGARYGTNYLTVRGQKLHDMAVTLGVDFALRKGTASRLGLNVELGQRGSTKPGQVRERYVNVVAAFSLFGDDFWFVRPKYN